MTSAASIARTGPYVRATDGAAGVSSAAAGDNADARGSKADALRRLLLLDNYDSFTFNLFHALGHLGVEVDVVRNDALSVDDVMAQGPDAVVISPGPCDPDRAGISLRLIECAAGSIPVLGVCLGHQAIGQVFGGRVVRASKPMHGRVSLISHDSTGVFAGLPDPFPATRYHSLVVERSSVPESLRVNAWTEDGMVMGLCHRELPVHGVQFHPESIETGMGGALLNNFLAMVPRRQPA